MVFGEINAGFSLWDRLTKWWHNKRNPPVESIVSRFVRLFESHGVHRNQIPRFFGQGLTLVDVQDDASLLAKLDEAMLDAACEKFAVRREWLDGAELQIHPYHDFYKNPKGFSELIASLVESNPDAHLQGVLIAPDELDEANALIILQENIGYIGEKPIFRYHLCNNWLFTYWKARTFLTACVAIAWKQHVFIHGVFLSKSKIEKLEEGNSLLGWGGEGIWQFGSVRWYPEDMALTPDAFLKDIAPERKNFGIKSALALWLDLDSQGLMDAGIKFNVRELFEQKLAQA
jgi:hypothetical protein